MDGKLDLLTVLSLVVAVIVILKLRNVLGRRTGDDEARIDRKIRAEQTRQTATEDKVVTLPRRDRPAAEQGPGAVAASTADTEAKVKSFADGNAEVEKGLLEIVRASPGFDADHFLQGAKQAYEMIVTAFAEGNRKILKDLLNREVFDGFSAVIAERESRGEQVDQSFVGIAKADIIEAELKDGVAHLSVKFLSQLISASRDRAGAVVAGDPQKIKDVTDVWTFARDLSSRDPNWRLVATGSS